MSAAVSAPGPSQDVRPVRRALVSVYDKTGLDVLVRGLHEAGVALVSTGGSAALIESLGLPVTKVEDLTGFPECLEGRVKTLHPRVHAGILADTRKPDHVAQLADLGVEAFELVVVNLYPFAATVASGASPTSASSRSTSAARRWCARRPRTTRASPWSPTRPPTTPCWMPCAAAVSPSEQRKRLAAQAFVHTATYDVHVASWMGNAYTDSSDGTGFPAWVGATWERATVLRYGENPHQHAALYTNGFQPQPALAQATQLHGKEMSYNNYVDADAAVRAAYDHGDLPTVAVIKHANPCGDRRRRPTSPRPPQGPRVRPGVGVRRHHRHQPPGDRRDGRTVADIFTEVVVAPAFDADALEVLTAKKNIRLLERAAPVRAGAEVRPIGGGLLMQQRDAVDAVVTGEPRSVTGGDDAANWRLVSGEPGRRHHPRRPRSSPGARSAR